MADKNTNGGQKPDQNEEQNISNNNNFTDLLKVNTSNMMNNTLFGLNNTQFKPKLELPKNDINLNLNSLQGIDSNKLKEIIMKNYNTEKSCVKVDPYQMKDVLNKEFDLAGKVAKFNNKGLLCHKGGAPFLLRKRD